MDEAGDGVTWSQTLSIWWAVVWRATVLSTVAGFVLGFIGGFIVGVAGRPDLGAAVGGVLGWLGSVPVSILVLKHVLDKRYRTFTIELVPITSRAQTSGASEHSW